jgi:hypothetical protein
VAREDAQVFVDVALARGPHAPALRGEDQHLIARGLKAMRDVLEDLHHVLHSLVKPPDLMANIGAGPGDTGRIPEEKEPGLGVGERQETRGIAEGIEGEGLLGDLQGQGCPVIGRVQCGIHGEPPGYGLFV